MSAILPSGRAITGSRGFRQIDKPYLLVSSIPCHVDDRGGVWIDPLWRRDLLEHLSYLRDFVLCAPRRRWAPGQGLVRFDVPPGSRVGIVLLPSQASLLHAIVQFPATARRLWRAVGRSKIVHSSVIGWPYPLGWLANPMAVARRRRLVVVVESSWLMEGEGRADWVHRLIDMNPIRTWLAVWSCNRADLALFSQPAYRDVLCFRDRSNAHVTPAVWVNEDDILDDRTAQARWEAKVDQPVRLLFAGRLVGLKGVGVLLDALRSLDASGHSISVDVVGEGGLHPECVRTAESLHSVRLSVLDPVPYGRPFLDLVGQYHGVIVPSLSDEQPRIVFDASAQAIPVLASDTDGLRPCVDHGVTGWLVPAGDSGALASTIARVSGDPHGLRSAGMAALRRNRGFTHKAMHRLRSQWLAETCG